jgi:endoglucanase
MKHLLILVSFLYGLLSANAQQLSFKEIRTASDTVLVAFFKSSNASGPVWNRVIQTNEVNTDDPTLWKLNGQPVVAVNKFVTPADACDYHIYLQTPRLVNGTAYTLETPYGNTNFVFDDKQIFCESIKVNQNAYSALSHVRYANFAIWLGDGGVKQISGDLPAYTVFKQYTGEPVAQGTLQQIGGGGQDASSDDYAYRIDLSAVPEGGPYKVSVKGYGCSYPFGVGADFSRRLEYISFRALYYQRCGIPIIEPYARANIRTNPCHTLLYDVNWSPIGEASLRVKGTEPQLTVYGGYHDAGDADRRLYHLIVPVILMTTYEVFPDVFTDDQYNIPDKFDANFHIIGKGNGIPDIIDEAEWGTMFWEYMQTTNGAVHWGTETTGYPDWGVTFDHDTKRYGTYRTDDRASGLASGIFMNLARLIKPYNPQRSAELEKRGDMAFNAVGDRIRPSFKLYYAIQKYLLTGDATAHQMVKDMATNANSLVTTYNRDGGAFVGADAWVPNFFMSYIIEKTRPTDPTVVAQFKAALKATADKEIGYLNSNAYPVGTSMSGNGWTWWGYDTAQGQYAYPCLMQWAVTKEQKYLDAVSQLMDYVQGLNPIGKCYVAGIGFDSVYHPHDRESTYAQDKGWGPRPGILVYGPGQRGNATQVPAVNGLARERQYVDQLGSIQWDEFTVYQTLVFPAAIYPVLAQGGKWDPTKDPFAAQQK